MIISTWLAYIAARKGVGPPFPSARALGIPAEEVGMVSLMERWLRKVEDGTSRFFRWTLAGTAAQRAESASAPPACPAASRPDPQVVIHGLSVAVPHGSVWELGKDNVDLISYPLGRSLSHSFLEERTTIQLVRRSMSQLVLQAKPDTETETELDTELDTDAQVLLSSED
ncbi:spermatogenesis-associated protein 19, mitochondrial [Gymnogyps californianus]|uniref:spermatogenesis-associated protein 19, mitochondrial n=1 Tax=Gymnogyps californianus TaxID=33616 RepID=UPI0021CA30F6|nr:spermatogenesis-associated protein 19, mitochondrial [Gymnogyps californianus]